MSEQDTLPRKPEKFFFDQHDFDEDSGDADDEAALAEQEPPPPTYTREELDAAREEGRAEGRSRALKEAEESREKEIADLVAAIGQNMNDLFAGEADRIALYETEAVALTRSIFEKLFPWFASEYGIHEIDRVVADVLRRHYDHTAIVINVAPDAVSDIEKRIDMLQGQLHSATEIRVAGDETLGPVDCAISWDDGGADRHVSRLAVEIDTQLKEALAERGALHDNSQEKETAPAEEEARREPLENNMQSEDGDEK